MGDYDLMLAVIVSDGGEPWRILVFYQDGEHQGARCTALGAEGGRCSGYIGTERDFWTYKDLLIEGSDGAYLRVYLPWLGAHAAECWIEQICTDCNRAGRTRFFPTEWEPFDPANHAALLWRKFATWRSAGSTTIIHAGWAGDWYHPVSWICPETGDIHGPRREEIETELARKRAQEWQEEVAKATAPAPRKESAPAAPVPQAPVPTALYRWFDASDLLLYIGISSRLQTRTGNHVKGSSWMEFATRSTVERFPSWPEAEAAEEAAIKAEHPLFNHRHNDTPEARRRLVQYLLDHERADLLAPAVSRG